MRISDWSSDVCSSDLGATGYTYYVTWSIGGVGDQFYELDGAIDPEENLILYFHMVPQGWIGDGSVLVGAAPPGEYFDHLLANGVALDQYFYWSAWQIGSGEVGGNYGGGLFKTRSDQVTGAGGQRGWITEMGRSMW